MQSNYKPIGDYVKQVKLKNTDNSLTIENANYIKDQDTHLVKNALLALDNSLFNNTRDLQTQIGDLDDLDTENKDDLVQAINETLYKATHTRFDNADSFDDAFVLQNL